MGSRQLGRWTWIYLGLVAFSLLGTLLTHWTGSDPGPIAPIAGALTLLAGVVAVLNTWDLKGPWRPCLLLAMGVGVELAGVGTGYPFGQYAYTGRWLPNVWVSGVGNYPLMVPFAWLLMAGGSALAVHFFWPQAPLAVRSISAGILAALLDLPMEPAMSGRLGYWKWLEKGPLPGGAPLANFGGWFLTAALATWIVNPQNRKQSWDALAVLGGQAILAVGLSFC